MGSPQGVKSETGAPAAEQEGRGQRRLVTEMCFDACDEMTCGTYQFPSRVNRIDLWVMLLITIVSGIIMYVGFAL